MIESVNNDKVKYYTKLNDKKYRESEGLFIASGKHLTEEAIKKGIVKEVFLLEGKENIYNATYASKEVLKKISGLDNAPEVLSICKKMENKDIKGNVLVLDDIKDPGNLGTMIRSAVAFNYETIILSKECTDVYNPKVVRCAEGMLFNINIIIDDLDNMLSKLKNMGYTIYGTNVTNGVKPTFEDNKHAIIIGSEAKGMNKIYEKYIDKNICIPMNKACESLNAAISASILMYTIGAS